MFKSWSARLAFVAVAAMPSAGCADGLTNPLLEAGPVPLVATPVPLWPGDPSRTALGALDFRGGVELDGAGVGFGGISALALDADGTGFLALSDIGFWVTGRLVFEDGRLAGVADAVAGRLRDRDGAPVDRALRDAEALAVVGDGTVAVAFEREHRVWAYAPDAAGGLSGVPTPMPMPPGLAAAARNDGLEALARLADGRWVGIAQDLADADGRMGWIGSGPPHAIDWQPFRYAAADGFDVADAAALPGGDLLVLERSIGLLTGARARLVHVPAAALRPGAVTAGTELAWLAPPLTVDNFEAVAVARRAEGTVILIASDDNFQPFQRSLLLAFLWPNSPPQRP
ncbi:MAG: esterase-like activity of phytase family protein [Alphaproteobacteria bacterium]